MVGRTDAWDSSRKEILTPEHKEIRTTGRTNIYAVKQSVLKLAAVLILLPAAAGLLSGTGDSFAMVRAEGDLDDDGRTEEYSLEDGVLTVREEAESLWKSPSDWHVDSFALGDADNDGTANLVMCLWKKGSFGEIRPFWHTGEDDSYKNHLFVYKLEGDTCKPVWCSSDLDRPILSLAIRDVNGDGLNELAVEEGQYRKAAGGRYAADPDAPALTTVWQWDEWGFMRPY